MSPRPVPSSVSAPSTVFHFYRDPVGPCEFMGRKNSCSGKSRVVSPMRMADRANVLSPVAPRGAVSIGNVGTPRGAHGNCGCNCKRASCRPVVSNTSATPSSRAKKRVRRRIAKQAMEEQLDFIMKDVDFNIQQKLAKADGERMRLRGNAAVITSSGTTPVGSKRGAHPAQLIATSTTPASQRNRAGSRRASHSHTVSVQPGSKRCK